MVIDPTTSITVVTPAASANYVAGSAALTETATISPAQAGVPIVFTAAGYGATTTYSFTPSTATTNSAGVATTTFQPSNHAGDATTVTGKIGTSAVAAKVSVGTITTVAGAPTEIAWTFASANANGNHYITTQGTTANGGGPPPTPVTGATMAAAGASFSIADRFGNPVAFSTAGLTYTVTLTALSGGGLFDALGLPSVITCTNGGASWKAGATALTPTVACPSAGTSAPLPFNYFQSSTYGAIGELSASVTGTLSSASYAGAGQSKLLVTSTFAAASAIPTVQPITGVTLPNVPAGDKVNVTATLATAQAGVPVTLYLDQATSYETAPAAKDYGANSMLAAGFSAGVFSTTVTTNANGQASALFTIDTVAGSAAFFQSNATAPTDASATHALGISADSASVACTAPYGPATVCTIAGKPTTFTVLTYFNTSPLANPTTHGATSGPIYVDVAISDAYGNLATNTGVTQIQITLSASCGTACPLSATTAYIPSGFADTYNSFGAIIWTMPSATGTVTLTASGVLNGVQKSSVPATLTVVSPLPTLAIISPKPTSSDIYSSTGNVVFTGEANVSLGYASSVTIASVTYKIDSGAVQSAPITSANQITFSVAATMSSGLHTITFNATDSNGNVVTGQKYNVLVDTAAPQVVFSTPNNANLTGGSSVTAKIAVLEGDLNASSVVATVNGTALASSQVAVTGSNVLGTNVTYTVTISGLSTGHDVVGLSASSLSGLTGTATSITIDVTVPFAQSFVVSGTPAASTLGTFAGISASYTNLNPSSQSVVIFAVFKNSAGQTMGIGTGSATFNAGATQSVFIADPVGLASGSYSVSIFVFTSGNLPVSTSTSISVTV